MKKFKVTCVKTMRVVGPGQSIMMFTEQDYTTDKDGIDINIPGGYQVVSVIEYLPPLIQLKAKT